MMGFNWRHSSRTRAALPRSCSAKVSAGEITDSASRGLALTSFGDQTRAQFLSVSPQTRFEVPLLEFEHQDLPFNVCERGIVWKDRSLPAEGLSLKQLIEAPLNFIEMALRQASAFFDYVCKLTRGYLVGHCLIAEHKGYNVVGAAVRRLALRLLQRRIHFRKISIGRTT